MRKCKGHCRGLLPFITDYLEGDAGKSICERIERHMVGCEKCRMYVDTHGHIIELYEKWRDQDMPRGVEARLQKRLRIEMPDGERGRGATTAGDCGATTARKRKKR